MDVQKNNLKPKSKLDKMNLDQQKTASYAKSRSRIP